MMDHDDDEDSDEDVGKIGDELAEADDEGGDDGEDSDDDEDGAPVHRLPLRLHHTKALAPNYLACAPNHAVGCTEPSSPRRTRQPGAEVGRVPGAEKAPDHAQSGRA